jgi:signal transduction histidine kinase/phage shock protein PspC (stress-responsive transcriptional regulator)
VPTPYELPHPPIGPGERRPVPRLERPVRGRHLGGVCAGLAEHLGLNVRHVRLAFVVASFAGGAGIAAYLFLWALTPQSLETPVEDTHAAGAGRPGNESVRNLMVGLGLLVVGAAFFAQQQGVNLRLGVLLPLLTVAAGAVLAWSKLDDAERGRWLAGDLAPGARRAGLVRLGIGIALATVGVVVLATQGRGLAGLWDVGIAAVAVLAGAALVAAPWGVRLWEDLRTEQTRRIRETERADIAAHLHDSVLQTLALIQRKAADPAEVVRLARAQERELRGWLYAGPVGSQASLASAVTEVAHEVEDLQGIPVELVVTGDRTLDAGGTALVRALREAVLNAVRHGAPPVSVYVEVGSELVEAFVRDHGPGFDLAEVPPDRLGVRESILGRMARHGGSATVRRLEQGTEVTLTLPVTAATHPVVQPDSAVQPDSVVPPETVVQPWTVVQPETLAQSETLAQPDTEGTRG